MKNEFGARLDRAGYAPSILQAAGKSCCYLCGKPAGGEKMDRHEPWNGANRRKSTELGLWVNLHHFGCHEGPGSVHGGNGDAARRLRTDAQTAAMLRYGWSYAEWLRRFGRSEISEAEADRLAGMGRTDCRGPAALAMKGEAEDGDANATSSGAARHIPLKGKACSTLSGSGWSGFQLLPDPDLPF